MMRKKLILIALLCIHLTADAQTFKEWMAQKQTQKEYLLQQIAALQVYIGYAKKGYDIAQKGLSTIGGFTKGEFDLHKDYFSSLSSVNPVIRDKDQVREIRDLQQKIRREYPISYEHVRSTGFFSDAELEYIMRVYRRLETDGKGVLEQLNVLVSDQTLEMKDDDRIRRIDALYRHTEGNYVFYRQFSTETRLLGLNRAKERNEIETSRILLGIK